VHVLESVLYVEDLAAARQFYVEVLGIPEIYGDLERHIFLRCDNSVLILFRANKTIVPGAGVPPHGTVGPGHVAFSATEEEIEKWRKRLDAAGLSIIEEVHWPNGAHSIYFHDPAENVLEFVTPNLYVF